MDNLKHTLRGEALKLALDDFSIFVTKNDAERIDYKDWRALVSLSKKSDITFYVLDEYKDKESILVRFISVLVDISILCPKMLVDFIFVRLNNESNIERKNTTMNMPSMNMEFGPVNNNIAISPYGLAVRNAKDEWITYNSATKQTMNVTGFTFDFSGMIYKMPAAISSIGEGDLILHQNKPMYVINVAENTIEAIDILSSEAKNIIPVTNMFGFNFVTKIISFINLDATNPSPDQPFGNLMPIMMASMMFGEDNNSNFGNMDMSKIMMMSMMTGNANPFGNLFNLGGNT